ncbi:MAG: hypothetical protein JW940_33700 [Polyangiaceae bacterium]|nr:hypothetical protein [Polyangiaceae bacterium]
MNHRHHLVALSANTLVLAMLLVGCGGDDDDSGVASTGGTSATGGGTGMGGATGTGGTATGTGGGGDPCSNVSPCGGDVIGTWTVTSSCLKVSGAIDPTKGGLSPVCSTGPVTEGTLQVTGTWDLKADGTFADNTSTTGEMKFALPAACKELSGTQIACAKIGGPLGSGLGCTVVCTDDAASGGCACTATVDTASAALAGGIGVVSASLSTTGTYTAASNVITTSDGVNYSYCVSGSTLTVSPQTETTGMGTTAGTVVFQK